MFSNIKFKDKVNMHGIGLGLTICKKILDSLQGFIQCKSQEGEGTKFRVEIPIIPIGAVIPTDL
jgi:signal transduction histidine kinase